MIIYLDEDGPYLSRSAADDMKYVLRLNEGSDTFELGDQTSLISLFADFGNDQDGYVLVDEFAGVYPFPVDIQNLP